MSAGGTGKRASNPEAVRDRLWLLQTRVARSVMLAETVLVMVYLTATPHGSHRLAVWIVALSCFALGLVSFFVVVPMHVARRWRLPFSLGWSVATSVITASVAELDGGLSSPLLTLLIVPVAFAGLTYPPASVAITASTAIAAASTVSAVDPHLGTDWPRLLVEVSVLIGISAISFAGSLSRTRLRRETDRLTKELAELATIDALTGCLNRRAFDEQCTGEVARSIRSGRSLAYVMIDVDNFKRINDTGGHSAGDRVLAHVGQTLRQMSRSTDIVARFGGDEFAILMPDSDSKGIVDLARRVHEELSRDGDDPLTLSYGGSTLEDHVSTLALLREEADRALYDAKEAGRDRIVVYRGGASRSAPLAMGEPLAEPT